MKPTLYVLACAVVLFGTTPVAAQSSRNQRVNRVEALTLELATAQVESPNATTDRGQQQRLARIATERSAEITQLVSEDPSAVLRLALPAEARAALPEAARNLVESHEILEGVVEVLQEDDDQGGRRHYFLRTPDRGRVSVHFAKDEPDVQSGQEVSISGVLVIAALVSESAASVVPVTGIAANTFGEQKTLVILVNFQNNTTQPYTTAAAANTMFTTANDWFLENSQNQTWFIGDVVGWFTLPIDATCDYTTLQTRSQSAAAAAGVDLSRYRRFIYAFPKGSCGWWGLGTVGGSTTHAWINGSFALKVVAHELGHNLGLYHAHALDCGLVTLGGTCSSVEYGDPVDMMGQNGKGHYTTFAKERLGWLNYGSSLPVLTINGPGTFMIDGYASLSSGPKALKIPKSLDLLTGRRTWFYVEYRAPVGFDSYLSGNANLTGGVMIHTGADASGDSSFVLDLAPATTTWNDAALLDGQSFVDLLSGVTIRAISTDGSSATVSVDLPAVPCVTGTPNVSMTPSATQWGGAGTTLSWTVSVKNNDSDGCSKHSIDLTPVPPTGWTASLAAPSLTLQPGETLSTTVHFTSPTSAVTGYNTVKVKADAHNGTGTPTASATYAVMSSFTVDVQASVSGNGNNRSVGATASVRGSGTPLAGVAVSFRFVKPDGSAATGSATTDSSGVARYSVKSRSTGTWSITARATINGITSQDTATVIVR